MIPRRIAQAAALATIMLASPALAWDPGVGVGRPGGGAGFGGVGGPAAVGRPGYPAARPPVAAARPVPVYPAYGRPAAPVAGAVAVGVVAGATAGAVARASTPPPATVVVTQPSLSVGTSLSALPAGCSPVVAAGTSYYLCNNVWLRPYMQGASVAYVVVPAP